MNRFSASAFQGSCRNRVVRALAVVLASVLANSARAAVIGPNDIFVAESKNDNDHGVILDINPITGAQQVIASGGYLIQPAGICMDAAGNIIVAEYGGSTVTDFGAILRINPTTGQQTLVSSGSGLIHPTAVMVDSAGYIIAPMQGVNQATGYILKIDPVTGAQSIVTVDAQGDVATGISPDGHGSYYHAIFQSQTGSRIVTVDAVTGNQTNLSTNGPMTLGPEQITLNRFAPNSLLVAKAGIFTPGTSALINIDTTTGAQTVLSQGGNFQSLMGVTQDQLGNTYVSDMGTLDVPRGLIMRIDLATGAQTVIASGGDLLTPLAIVANSPEPASLTLLPLLGLMIRRRQKSSGCSRV